MQKKVLTLALAGLLIFTSYGTVGAAYSVGSRGDDVKLLQRKLVSYGYRIKTDGKYSNETKAAVKNFQKRHKLDADGIVGPKTFKVLMGKDMPGRSSVKQGGSPSYSKGYKLGIDDSTVKWRSGSMTQTVKDITDEAKKYVGVPYQFGGTTPKGFDCSGFIQFVFNRKGIKLPRSADEQYSSGKKVQVNALEPGDLVFFNTYDEGISHSGLYLGDGYFISATSSRGVAVATMKSGYWHDRYIGANRIL